jgi:xanthine dehydrogenase YagT iron-sulfur-binding subunit
MSIPEEPDRSGQEGQGGQDGQNGQNGLTRRSFLKGMGAGALAAGAIASPLKDAAAKGAPQAAGSKGLFGPDPVPVKLQLNGKEVTLPLEPRVTLLDALRNHLDLTGAKKVCDRATCGACTVLLDGKAVYSCTVLAIEAQGRKIETVEGLAEQNQGLAKMQRCFVENDAQQCGFCTPGFVMACESFRRAHPKADRHEVVDGLGGNLCRCGTYHGVTNAVLDAIGGGK